MCHWPKYELFSYQTFCNLITFPMTKLLKIQYLLHLKSNFFKPSLLKLIHQGLSNNLKTHPNFPISFNFYLNKVSLKKMFNI